VNQLVQWFKATSKNWIVKTSTWRWESELSVRKPMGWVSGCRPGQGGMEEQGNEVLVTCSKSHFLNLFHYPRIEGHYNPFWILHSCAAVPHELSALGCVSIKVDQHCFLVRHCRLNLLHTLVFIFFILFPPLPNPPLANAELPTQQAKSPWAPRRVSQPRLANCWYECNLGMGQNPLSTTLSTLVNPKIACIAGCYPPTSVIS